MNLELWAATVESVAIRGQDTSLGDVEESDAAEIVLCKGECFASVHALGAQRRRPLL